MQSNMKSHIYFATIVFSTVSCVAFLQCATWSNTAPSVSNYVFLNQLLLMKNVSFLCYKTTKNCKSLGNGEQSLDSS